MKSQNIKAVYSIRDTCEALQLSRARFYQLLKAGILPQPMYDDRSKRPFYTLELYEKCCQVKETCTGINNQYILFYTPRQKPQSNAGRSLKKKESEHQDIVETLIGMGLDVSKRDVNAAVRELYPNGIEGHQGLVIREIYRFLKKKMSN
jgi:hypothetical protein